MRHFFQKNISRRVRCMGGLLLAAALFLAAVPGCAAESEFDLFDEAETQGESAARRIQGRIGYVTGAEGGLNVRQEPSTTAPCVRRIYNGEPVIVTQELDAEDLHWGQVTGGWICTNFVAFEDDNEEAEYYCVSPSAKEVNIRNEAGTSHRIVGRLYVGESVAITQQVVTEGRTWGKTGKGWICMDYLIPAELMGGWSRDDFGENSSSDSESSNDFLDFLD